MPHRQLPSLAVLRGGIQLLESSISCSPYSYEEWAVFSCVFASVSGAAVESGWHTLIGKLLAECSCPALGFCGKPAFKCMNGVVTQGRAGLFQELPNLESLDPCSVDQVCFNQ